MEAGETRIEVILALQVGGERIRGAVRTDGRALPFDGWMQLAAALEDARLAGQVEPAGGGPSRETDR